MTDTTKERAQLIAEIARELYDRFVMGGWEPQDAYAQIGEWLARAEQSTETPPRWIPVEERLPERSGEYLIVETGDVEATAADFFIELEHLRKRKWMTVRTFGVDSEERELYGVTHWMPLPAPPVAEAPRPVGTPLGRCPQCESHDRKLRNLLGRIGYFHHCENSWHDGPVGTPERGKKP